MFDDFAHLGINYGQRLTLLADFDIGLEGKVVQILCHLRNRIYLLVSVFNLPRHILLDGVFTHTKLQISSWEGTYAAFYTKIC